VANESPSTAAMPMRKPVNEPGPTATAKPSISWSFIERRVKR
jgi:hypothetical protein